MILKLVCALSESLNIQKYCCRKREVLTTFSMHTITFSTFKTRAHILQILKNLFFFLWTPWAVYSVWLWKNATLFSLFEIEKTQPGYQGWSGKWFATVNLDPPQFSCIKQSLAKRSRVQCQWRDPRMPVKKKGGLSGSYTAFAFSFSWLWCL